MSKNDKEMGEAEGIKAIIFLQASVGVVESVEKAKRGWAMMTASDREATAMVYRALSKGKV